MDNYLKSLRPVASPRLVDGKLSEAALRGRAVFEKAGCARCHSGPYHTDMRLHNVGVGTGQDAETRFDTPTLVESWRTAPYLYDGRAATMREVLVQYNKPDRHGHTANLTDAEIDDLAEYVLSL